MNDLFSLLFSPAAMILVVAVVSFLNVRKKYKKQQEERKKGRPM
jgi:hypothetical protein